MQKQTLKLLQNFKVFDLLNEVILQIQSLEIFVLLKILNLCDCLIHQIQLVVHLWVFVQTLHVAEDLQIAMVQNQTAILTAFEGRQLTRDMMKQHLI